MPLSTPAFKADGDVYPCRFVSISDNSGKDFYVEESATSGLAAQIIGISGESSKDGRSDAANTKHAEAEDTCLVHGHGDVCLLEMAATCTKGQRLKANVSTDGKGTPVTSGAAAKEYYGAIALQACLNAGEKIRVQVLLGINTTPA
jgi:hypothetical protein